MKRLLYILLFIMFPVVLSAQDYIVESVEHLPADMKARTYIKKDGKDRQCAVLRIATQGISADKREGFFFQPDFGSEVVERSVQDGEIWLWVSPGIKVLCIKHKELGSYELHFTKYLAESVQELHTYKVILKAETPVVVGSGFGILKITTQPDGATISINGREISQKTPYNNEMIPAGKYEITISKERYKTVVKTVEIANNANGNISEILKPDYASITVFSNDDAEIFIDGRSVGTGTWKGELLSGNHVVKCSGKYHSTVERTIEVVAENDAKYEIHPTPILGVVEISSDPSGATVYIDGKNYGVTPLTLSNIIIGPHELKLEKNGCASVNKSISLDNGKTLVINEKLPTGRDINIATDKPGDKIYVDENYIGVTPLKVTLAFGTHKINAERSYKDSNDFYNITEPKSVRKTILVEQGEGVIKVVLPFKGILLNDYDAIDLGLPSGTLWAICNIGADSPEDYGDYFAWGETQVKNTYSWTTYRYCRDTKDYLTKYNVSFRRGIVDNKKTLELSDDVANTNWGDGWRMPTYDEFLELKNQCNWKWMSRNGKSGYIVIGPNGNCIFLPAGGGYNGDGLYDIGNYGGYWSCSLDKDTSISAYELYFNSQSFYVSSYNGYRCYGLSIRPVCSPQEQ